MVLKLFAEVSIPFLFIAGYEHEKINCWCAVNISVNFRLPAEKSYQDKLDSYFC
ncbi:hypothetical protein MGLY_27410 [Neomoorella glycerini]|uniref:Uncharacterized protein n=1 Tax=Neomoorella glycerini TaxID=55779 RepID=A0A6I5ZTS8_9FIRM|nr:hypothetical protein MGLY_27410 [Moorella glycerini]